jgi:hypothetical protein
VFLLPEEKREYPNKTNAAHRSGRGRDNLHKNQLGLRKRRGKKINNSPFIQREKK